MKFLLLSFFNKLSFNSKSPTRLLSKLSFLFVNNKILFNLFIGIFISVLVYYLGHFSNLLGENGRLPLILSVWFPIIMLTSFSAIGVIRLNEK